jgi:hypothetical protein
VEGPQVSAYFGADVDWWEWAGGVYQDVMVGVDAKRGGKMGGVVVKVGDVGNQPEEVSVYVLLLRTPKFLTTFVDNGVLVGVLVSGEVTSRGSEEMWEEVNFDGEGKWLGGG